jgi:hypothetical protein
MTVPDSQNEKIFTPNCEDFRRRNCSKERCPLHKVSDSSTEIFWEESTGF